MQAQSVVKVHMNSWSYLKSVKIQLLTLIHQITQQILKWQKSLWIYKLSETLMIELEKVATPDQKTIEEVSTFLNVDASNCY